MWKNARKMMENAGNEELGRLDLNPT